jgi:hypothetical protein
MSWDAFGAALDDWISGKVAEKKREKGLGAIGTLEKERNASDMYQGAQKRTDEWLASLSPEDLKRVRPDSTRVASNFEGIGDVKNFDLDKRQRQLGLTSEFSTLPEVQNYIKMNDVEKKNKLNTDISTDLQKAAMAISGQRKKQENVDNYKKTGDILSELNITMPQPFSKEGMSTLQSPYMQNVELRKQITSGNDAGFLPIEFQKKDKGYSDLGGKLLNYEPEKPLSNREIWLKYGLNKYDDPRVKDFYEQNVKDPEELVSKGKSEAVVPGQLRKGNLAGLIEDYRRPEMKDFVKKKLEEFKNNTGFDENVFQTKLDAIDAGEGYVVSKFIDEYYSQGQKNNQKVDLENKLIEPRTKTKASTTTAGLQATKDEGAILSETAAERLGDFDASISQMGELLNGLNNPDAPQGPIAQWKKVNPYDWQAQGKQQLVAATKQLIGKALEGGVLRKEDEDKYAKILPTMGDTYESAKLKTEQLSAMLNNAYTAKRSAFKNAGYDVTKFSGSVKVGAKPGLPGNYDPGLAGKEGDAIKERSAWTPDKQKRLEELRRKKAAGELK